MKKQILITGAGGFIGSHLLQDIIDKGVYEAVILIKNSSDAFRINEMLSKCKVYYAEDTNLESIFTQNKIEGIIHLATYYKKTHLDKDIEDMIASNITFPTKLIELSSKYECKFFINTGTFFEYSMFSNPINESTSVVPYNLYASTKIGFDAVLKYYANNSTLNILTLKLAAPFGYNDNQKLIPFLIGSLLEDREVALEKGEQEWDFIYVKDVVNAFKKAIEFALNSQRSLYEDVLIGTGTKVAVKDIANILNKLHGKELIKCTKEYPTPQIFEAYIDNSKAKNMLQWLPRYSIEEALSETYNLYKENRE